MSFEQFGLNSQLEEGIKDAGFTEPTAIQSQAIPIVLDGRDVMGLAQTGTGKTAAFALPILHNLQTGPRRRIRALVIAPTRELAEQTHEAFTKLGSHTGLKSMVVYGGVNINPQKADIRSGKAEIMVACPGRLLDHLGQGGLNLSQVSMLVLDEADRMLDMGFLPDIKRILKFLPPRRQSLMFSATMPNDIRRLVTDVLKDYVTIQIGREAPAQNVTHELYTVPHHLKTALLKAILKDAGDGPKLVFTRTRIKADSLGTQLKHAGFKSASIQGDMTQARRQAALNGFRDGDYKVLVATDVAARGIDVDDITHVINYDIPDNVEDYIHRVGRTGRASKTGKAYSLVTPEDNATIMQFEREVDVELITKELDGFDYSVPAPPRNYKNRKSQRTHKTHSERREARSGGKSAGGGSSADGGSADKQGARKGRSKRRRRPSGSASTSHGGSGGAGNSGRK